MTSDENLMADLRALTSAIETPPVRDMVAGVRSDIAALAPVRRRGPWLPRVATAAAAALAVVAVLSVASPTVRTAIADWLGVPGIAVRVEPTPPVVDSTRAPGSTPTEPVGDPLPLEDEVSLAAARDAVSFDVPVPDEFGPPDRVYLDDSFSGGAVTQVWGPARDLPELRSSDVGALFSVFHATLDDAFLTKVVAAFDDVEAVEVDGARGVWVGGDAHVLVRDANGRDRSVAARLAGNTLLWARDGVTYRLESGLERDAAIAVAGSLR